MTLVFCFFGGFVCGVFLTMAIFILIGFDEPPFKQMEEHPSAFYRGEGDKK